MFHEGISHIGLTDIEHAAIYVCGIFFLLLLSILAIILELWTFKVDELKITRKIGNRKIRGRKRIKQSRKIYSMGGCERYQVRSLILCIIKGEDWRFMKELFAPRLAKCLDMNCSVFE